jgi:Uma2 family endonuclease
MATVAAEQIRRLRCHGEQRIVLHGIEWTLYVRLLDATTEQHVRMAYDQGTLELMSPSTDHERLKKLMGQLVEALLFDLEIDYEALGASTWKDELAKTGLEADECYVLDPAKLTLVTGRSPNGATGPFPDLALEVEFTSSAVNKLAIYASLGVVEVWRLDEDALSVLALTRSGTYEPREHSQFLPVRPDELFEQLLRAQTLNMRAWLTGVHAWIKTEVAPRRRGNSA